MTISTKFQSIALSKWALMPVVAVMAQPAFAQDVTGSITKAVCGMIKPFVGQDSRVLSLLFIVALAVLMVLWFVQENKEGVLTWVLRAGIAMGILINIFTLPSLLGLPSPCGG